VNNLSDKLFETTSSISLEVLKSVHEFAPMPTIVERDFKIIYANPDFKKMLRFNPKKDLVGYEIINLLPDEQKSIVRELSLKRQQGDDLIKSYVIIMIANDGGEVEVKVHANKLELDDGPCIITYFQDLTIYKQLITQQESFKSLYKNAIENAPEPTILTDITGRQLLHVNKQFMELIGYSPEEFTNKDDILKSPRFSIKGVPNEQKLAVFIDLQKKLMKEGTVEYELQFKSRTKGIIHLLGKASIVELEGQKFARVTFDDITEKIDYILRLKESEELFRVLIDEAPEAIAIFDVKLNQFIHVNEAYAKMHQLSKLEIINKHPADSSFNPEYQVNGEKSSILGPKIIKNVMAKKNAVYEWLNILPNGEELKTEIHLLYIKNINLEIIRSMKIDVSERYKLQDELEDTYKEIAHALKLEAVGRLAGGISHDFNNALTSIIGYAEFITATTEDSIIKDYVQEIYKIALSSTEMVKKLQLFAKNRQLNIIKEDVNKILTSIERIIKTSVEKSINVLYKLEENLPKVDVDTYQFQNAIINLVKNANYAIEEYGTIIISSRLINKELLMKRFPREKFIQERYVEVAVKDDGSGIPKENQDRIFEPFFTTKEEGKGTGLGLSSIYGLMQSLNGCIQFKSILNVGTTFYLYFPVEEVRK
jgi:two-component system, cell cycle sensor histidine kinase and response regulator CckA